MDPTTQYFSKQVTLLCGERTVQDRLNTMMDIGEVRRRVQASFQLKSPFRLVYADLGSQHEIATDGDVYAFLKYPRIAATVEVHLSAPPPPHEQGPPARVPFQRSLHTSKWATASTPKRQRSSEWSPKPYPTEATSESFVQASATPPPTSRAAELGVTPPAGKMEVAARVRQLVTTYSQDSAENPRDSLACDLLVDQVLNDTGIDTGVLHASLLRIQSRATEQPLLDLNFP